MGNCDHRGVPKGKNTAIQVRGHFFVKGIRPFVNKKQRQIMQQRPRNADALALTAGKIFPVLLDLCRKSILKAVNTAQPYDLLNFV